MGNVQEYRAALRDLTEWDAYIKANCGLPGPRGNLELGEAVAIEGHLELFNRYLEYTPEKAPENTPDTFLAFCGALGLGRLLSEGQAAYLDNLRTLASDPRWRIREGVAMALQWLGDTDMARLVNEMKDWSRGNAYEQRAAVAALCEPRLLKESRFAMPLLDILDQITTSLPFLPDRKGEAALALKKGLAYCWSVAVAAYPEAGKPVMEKWLDSQDKDIRWIMKENLKKNRLLRVDAAWVEKCQAKMDK